MSDYISKSGFSEALNKSEKQPTRDSEDFIEGYCEGWNDVVDIMKNQPTLSETEVIRKAFERVIKRICNVRNNTPSTDFKNGCNASLHQIHREIDIDVKECGISE